MNKVALIMCFIVLSCSTTSTSITHKDDSPRTVVQVETPRTIDRTKTWIKEELPKYCKQIDVPVPPIIRLKFTIMAGEFNPITGFKWVQGYYRYGDKSIDIWMVKPPFGAPLSFDEVREVILHELLHYLNDVKHLKQTPIDHNELFKQMMRDLGWIK